MITQSELEKIIIEPETDRIEKTISLKDSSKFGEAICSFANDLPNHNKPGYLIIGVLDNGTRNGTIVQEYLLQLLMDFRTDGRINPPPALAVAKFSYPDGDVAVVEVQPSSQPPVRYNGKVCVRIGPRKGIANETEERILSEKRSSFARTFDTLPCYDSTLDDIKEELYRITYLPKAIDKETLEQNHRGVTEQLSSLKFFDLKTNCPTNGGILMFGKRPRFFMPGAYVQYVRFKGDHVATDFDFEKRFEGDLATQMRIMEEFIQYIIVREVQHNLGEPYQYNYPMVAIKELLFNAIIHKNYQSNAPIKFYEFSDRIEISNPGGLYGAARPENFPNKNDYRNPVLAEAAKNLGYINSFNVGVKRAMNALKENGNADPVFTLDDPTGFEVVVYRKEI